MTVYVTYKEHEDENEVHVSGIDRVSRNTLISNVCCMLVWIVRKLFVHGKVIKFKTISKQDLIQNIRILGTPSKTYRNLRSDPIKHAYAAIERAGWTVKPDWTCRKGASKYVRFTTNWFKICDQFMKIPTGYVTNKVKFHRYVLDALIDYIMAQPTTKQKLEDPLALLPQLDYFPQEGINLNQISNMIMALTLDDTDSDSNSESESAPLSMDF